jgi:hypothetical protein
MGTTPDGSRRLRCLQLHREGDRRDSRGDRPAGQDRRGHGRQTYSRWRSSKPCAHENFYILELRLGNIDGIGRLRKLLKAADFPVLCGKVIHSAVHSGDAVPVEDLKRLQDELRRLRSIGPETQPFANLLEALVEAALQAGKPIGF